MHHWSSNAPPSLLKRRYILFFKPGIVQFTRKISWSIRRSSKPKCSTVHRPCAILRSTRATNGKYFVKCNSIGADVREKSIAPQALLETSE